MNDRETPLVSIDQLDNLCRATFKGYQSLNRIQSLVYPVAYRTNENMLICAPTGAVRSPSCSLTLGENGRRAAYHFEPDRTIL